MALPGDKESPRGKGKLVWILIGSPVVVGMALVVYSCVCAYLDGYYFRSALQFFAWLIHVMRFAIPFGIAVVISVAASIVWRRRLRQWGSLGPAYSMPAVGFLCAFVALVVMQFCFFWGRNRAYARLDHAAIHAGCEELRASLEVGDRRVFLASYDEEFKVVPPAIASLEPKSVSVADQVVVIWVAGGGPGAHEGLGVILADFDEGLLVGKGGIRRLGRAVPVFLFRLYDHRIFFDRAEEAMRAEQNKDGGEDQMESVP